MIEAELGTGHVTVRPPVLYVGTPVFLVCTENSDASFNLAPASSYWALGQMLVLGLEADGQSIENLADRPEMTVNFPSGQHWQAVERIAEVTGRNPVPPAKAGRYRFETDKFALAGFHPQPSAEVRPPRVAECSLQFEALARRITPGVDQSYFMVEAEVVRVHADRAIVLEGTDRIDPHAWKPLVYSFRHYFDLGQGLGPRGQA